MKQKGEISMVKVLVKKSVAMFLLFGWWLGAVGDNNKVEMVVTNPSNYTLATEVDGEFEQPKLILEQKDNESFKQSKANDGLVVEPGNREEELIIEEVSPLSTNVSELNVGVVGRDSANLIKLVTNLENSNRQLQIKLDQLERDLLLLSENMSVGTVDQVESDQDQIALPDKKSIKVTDYVEALKEQVGTRTFIFGIAILILVLFSCLVYLLITYYHRSYSVAEDHDHVRYDELTEEGVAAKLNLARAYVDMGRDAKAKSILQEILAYGSDVEQEEAKQLLDKLKYGEE